MINFIEGKLEEKNEDKIVVSNGFIAFDINFPKSNMKNLPEIGEKVKIYTYLSVKEDDMSLFGFLTKEDKIMFNKLLTVNGVGPKGALSLISNLGFTVLQKSIINNDSKTIATVQGIGQKTASKICIELGDKVAKMKFDVVLDIIKENNEKVEKLNKIKDEVVLALVALGFQRKVAIEKINQVEYDENITVDELLKLALKN